MSIISRLRAAWSAIMDVTGEQPAFDVAAPNTAADMAALIPVGVDVVPDPSRVYSVPAVERRLEDAIATKRQALAGFDLAKAAHDVARAAVDDAAVVVHMASAEVAKLKDDAERAEASMIEGMAKVEDWVKKLA